MAATKTTKRTTKPKSPATKKAAAKSVVAPRKRAAVAQRPVTQTNVKTVVSLADDEKRLMLLVIVWLALIGVFLGMVVYQIYLS